MSKSSAKIFLCIMKLSIAGVENKISTCMYYFVKHPYKQSGNNIHEEEKA